MPYGEGYVSIGNVIGASEETGSFGGYNVADYGFGGSQYNSLTAYYGYGYNSYTSGVAGTSPFFASFSASTGYGGGPANLGDLSGGDITGNFASTALAFSPGTDLAFPSEPWVFGPNYDLPNSGLLGFVTSGPNNPDYPNALYNFALNSFDATPQGAAALAGALSYESGGNPMRLQGGGLGGLADAMARGIGFGIAQWTDESRQQGLGAWARSEGLSAGSLELQEGFMMRELMMNPAYAGVFDALQNPNLTQADVADIVVTEYLRPQYYGPEGNEIRSASEWQPSGTPLFILYPMPFMDY